MATDDIDTAVLRSLVAVATSGSFSQAAERLNCSTATVSVRIKNLEDRLGLQLFNRRNKHSSLTPAGEEVLARVKTLVNMHDEIAHWGVKNVVGGSVRVGLTDNYVTQSLPHLLQNITRHFPTIEVSFICDSSQNLRRYLEQGDLDLAIATACEQQTDGAMLANRELLWAASPAFVVPESGVLPLAIYPEGCVLRRLALEQLERCQTRYNPVFTSTNGEAIKAAVQAGMAVTVMADGTLPTGLQRLDLEFMLPHPGSVNIRLLERTGENQLAVAAVKKEIMRVYG